MNADVPFFENPDKTHCYQVVIRMILKHYWPDKNFTWQELETITAKVPELWTWPTAGILWLKQNGFDVRAVEAFDYKEFADTGEKYLIGMYGEKVAQEQIKHSNLEQEIALAKQLAGHGISECRIPQYDEIKSRVDEGYLVICNVNSCTLNDKPGYIGHFVLVTGYNGDDLIMHDPGVPGTGKPYRRESKSHFESAWAYPNERAKDYIAVKV